MDNMQEMLHGQKQVMKLFRVFLFLNYLNFCFKDGDNLPTQEEERGVPYRDMSVSLMENVTFSRESLVVGIGGIATLPDGENVYICTADNTYAVSSISVQLNIPGCY